VELWTAKDSILDALEYLYTATENAIQDQSRIYGTVVDQIAREGDRSEMAMRQAKQQRLKYLLTQLAAAICTNMEDKCRSQARSVFFSYCYCQTPDQLRRQMEDGADPLAGLELDARWKVLKPRVIRPLGESAPQSLAWLLLTRPVDIDRINEAYDLADHHSDFPSLVYLCHHPRAGKGQVRIQEYIEKFGEDFAFVLYQWYIDHGTSFVYTVAVF
jgi:nuclear pore complex protein Nup133